MNPGSPLPSPPYYAVIFASQRRDGDQGYAAMAKRVAELAAAEPGFIGLETSRDASGFGITVSYWRNQAALMEWKQATEHLLAQKLGKTRWYEHYTIRVAKVERAYDGPEGRG